MQLATKTKVIAAKKVSVSFLKDREKNPGAKCLFFVESILGPNLFLEDDEKGITVRRIQLRTLWYIHACFVRFKSTVESNKSFLVF